MSCEHSQRATIVSLLGHKYIAFRFYCGENILSENEMCLTPPYIPLCLCHCTPISKVVSSSYEVAGKIYLIFNSIVLNLGCTLESPRKLKTMWIQILRGILSILFFKSSPLILMHPNVRTIDLCLFCFLLILVVQFCRVSLILFENKRVMKLIRDKWMKRGMDRWTTDNSL